MTTKVQGTIVPSGYMFLSELPLSTSSKVNRRLLPEPQVRRSESAIRSVAPATEYEVAISSIWKRVLNTEVIGIDDNFFDLGGHSLRLVQVQGELARSLGDDVPLVMMCR